MVSKTVPDGIVPDDIVPDADDQYKDLGDNKDDAESVALEPEDNEIELDDLPNTLGLIIPDHDEQYTVGRRTNVDLGPNDDGRTANEGRDVDPRVSTTIPALELPVRQTTLHLVPIQAVAGGHRRLVEAPSPHTLQPNSH